MFNNHLNLLVTAVLLVSAVMFFEFSDVNNYIQNHFYNQGTKSWIVDRNNPILDLLLYSGIKKVFVVVILFLLFALVFLRRFNWVYNNKKGLSIVVASCLIIPLAVGALKASTNMPCPNQITEFGGKNKEVGLFEVQVENSGVAVMRCYPAGHASGGFALLSLLFLFKTRRAKIITFVSVMSLGWSTGNYKMLIGDHYIGHTIVTMLLVWLLVLIIKKAVDKVFFIARIKGR